MTQTMIHTCAHFHAQAERRERDALAVKTFEAGVAAISEDMELRVLEASYTLRDGIEEAEKAVALVRAEMDMDDRLVQGDMAYVEVCIGHSTTVARRHQDMICTF